MRKYSFITGITLILLIFYFCGCAETDQTSNDQKSSGQEYNWSTMLEGPYRDKVSFATGTDLLNWADSQKILAEHASVPGAVYKDSVIYVYFVDVSEDGIRFSRKGIFDPDVIEVNGVWRMYVGDIEGNTVISAISYDGMNFNEEGTAYSEGAVPDVFFKNNTYYLYVAGIDIATSQDGAIFVKTPYSFQSQLGTLTADPSVIELNDGTYIMFYKTKE